MKLIHSTALAALCWTARLASAASGHVYIIDPQSEPRQGEPRSLSPVPARLVLAQRAGVEEYHSADLAEEGVIDAINEFGVRTHLFGEQAGKMPQKAMILVEGVSDPEAEMLSLKEHTSFALTPAPGATANRGLWVDLAKQAQPSAYSQLSDDEALERMQSFGTQFSNTKADIFYIASSMSDFESIVKNSKIAGSYAITAYITPPGQYARTGDGTYQWGTYTMPDTQSPLRKRTSQRPQKEAPLEEASETTSYQPVHSFSAPISALAPSNSSTTPLPGILPQCFTSQSQCETLTRNCTGHGTCFKKYTDTSAAEQSRNKVCYTCGCSATVQDMGEGKVKTTYWGGPACQKRDVSVQFWILALFSVGMVFLVGFAVGEVWGMGNEELPSVIGAGVSGPTAKR